MTSPPTVSLTEQMLRRRPVIGAPVAHGAADHLKRTIGTFQLTMFGVGATVGTGIFFVLSAAVPEAGPAVIISFIIAGIAAGLAAHLLRRDGLGGTGFGLDLLLRLHDARRVRRHGRGGLPAARIRRLHRGGRRRVEQISEQVVGQHLRRLQLPQALTAAPWDDRTPGMDQPARRSSWSCMCALLLIRGASESAMVNTIMVIIKLGVLGHVRRHRVHRLPRPTTSPTSRRSGVAAIGSAAGTIFFSYIGLDAVSTAGDEVKDPQKTMPRAIIAALLIVTTVYVLVAIRRARRPERGRCSKARPAGLARSSTTSPEPPGASTVLAAGAVISIFSVTLVTMYGQTRILFAMGRDGLLPSMFAKVNPKTHDAGEQHDHRRDRGEPPGRLRPAGLPDRHGVDRHTDRVHRGVDRRHHPAGARTRSATRVQGAAVLRSRPILSMLACALHPVQPALVHLDRVRRMGVGGAGLLPAVGPPPQRTQRRRRRHHRNGRPRRRRRRDRHSARRTTP